MLWLSSVRAEPPEPIHFGIYVDLPNIQEAPLSSSFSEQLKKNLPRAPISISYLNDEGIKRALSANQIDILITHSAHYLELQHQNNALTLLGSVVRQQAGTQTSAMAGTIIVKSNRNDLDTLTDLKGKKIGIFKHTTLDSLWSQAMELRKVGVQLPDDIYLQKFPSHRAVVEAVLTGKVDAGFIRSGVLEILSKEDGLSFSELSVLNKQHLGDYPFSVSTSLYPEWPVVALPHLNQQKIREIASALFAIDVPVNDAMPAAIVGIRPPLSYLPVERTLQTLNVPPYDERPHISWFDIWQQHTLAVSMFLLLLILLSITITLRQHLLKRLKLEAHNYHALNARLNDILESTDAGTWEYKIQEENITLNRQWSQLLGYSQDQLEHLSLQQWRDLSHPDDLPQSLSAMAQHFSGARNYYECDLRMKHAQGHWVWIHHRGKVINTDADGLPLLMTGMSQDIDQRKKLEEALVASEQQTRLILDHAMQLMGVLTPDGKVLQVNKTALDIVRVSESDVINRYVWDTPWLSHSETAKANIRQAVTDTAQGKNSYFETTYIGFDLKTHFFDVFIIPVSDDRGQVQYLIAEGRDITEQRLNNESLRLSASVFTHAREAIMITDRSSVIVDVNSAFTSITGYERNDVIGHHSKLLNSGRHSREFFLELWDQVLKHGHWTGEMWQKRKNGEEFPERLTISAVKDSTGEITHYVALFTDITSIKAHEEQLKRLAHYDALTNLPNRLLLADRLNQAMNSSKRNKTLTAIVLIDLDGFKAINDLYGHEAGDQLLINLAANMKDVLRDSDTLSRLGGDEFVALLPGLTHHSDCLPMLNRLLGAISQTTHYHDYPLSVSASLGVSIYPQAEDLAADQLLRQADQAMYQAKLAGKNRYRLFDIEHDRSVRSRHELLGRVEEAINNNELIVHYQPKVNMRSGTVIGVEALVRWEHPEQGLVSPAHFLPIIEDHPLSMALDLWVINHVLHQLNLWNQMGLKIKASINISSHFLQHAEFVHHIKTVLEQHKQIDGHQVELEILETSALDNLSHVSRAIQQLQPLGITFAIDDFGTGYSSLSYLKRLPAQVLKVDRSFVRDMHEDPDDMAILEAVRGLATAFHRDLLAEGVETPEQGELLIWLGYDLAQGYGIAKPMPGPEFATWIGQWQPDARWVTAKPAPDHLRAAITALSDHNYWTKGLIDFTSNNSPTPPEIEYANCGVGTWLNQVTVPETDSALAPLTNSHRQLLDSAQRLLQLKHEGRALELNTELIEFNHLRAHLGQQLRAYISSQI